MFRICASDINVFYLQRRFVVDRAAHIRVVFRVAIRVVFRVAIRVAIRVVVTRQRSIVIDRCTAVARSALQTCVSERRRRRYEHRLRVLVRSVVVARFAPFFVGHQHRLRHKHRLRMRIVAFDSVRSQNDQNKSKKNRPTNKQNKQTQNNKLPVLSFVVVSFAAQR